MQVTVRFFGLFKRYTGEAQRVYDLADGSSAGDLLRLIGEDYGPRLPGDLWNGESGHFHRSIRVMRSGGTYLRETEPLDDGDELLLLYAMSGG